MEAWWSQIELPRPEWLAALLVLPPMILSGRRGVTGLTRQRQATALFCRAGVVVALVLALCGVRAVKPWSGKFLVFAVDESLSVPGRSQREAGAFVEEALKTLGENQAAVLPFARRPAVVRHDGTIDKGALDRRGTNLAAAIRAAGAAIPPDFVSHVVLLTDGNATEGDALGAARGSGVPISTVPLASADDPEVYVSAVQMDGRARRGEPFEVEVVLRASGEDEGTLELMRDGASVERRGVRVRPGANRFRFAPSIIEDRLVTFTARIDGFRDTLSDNNVASLPVFTEPAPRVLLVASGPRRARHLATALEGERIDVETREAEDVPTSAIELDRYDLIFLSNVPAAAIQDRMEAIRSYVRDFGGGLAVIGGDRALTAGGYRQTALEEILPVWCVADTRRERPSLAMVLVMDRSGSMEGASIELAKEAARGAVGMLGAADQLGVMAFEDNSRWVSRLAPCVDKDQILAEIDTMIAGGGTDLYPAIDKAYLALDEAFAERKHMIVLTDGASHPGDFEALLTEIAEAGITVSTVAVGGGALAGLLKEMARIGRGHYYHCDDPAAVPEVFARETAVASRSGIVDGPFFVQSLDAGAVFAEIDVAESPSLLSYVETRAKRRARVVLASERGDPLLVWWRYGLGTSVAFTSDVEGRWAAPWLRWPGFGRFWSMLARHAMRGDQAEDFRLQLLRQNGLGEVTLEATDREFNPLNGLDVTLRVIDPECGARQIDVGQVAPGRYAAAFSASRPGSYYVELRASQGERLAYVQRRGLAVDYADELRTRPTNHDLLRSIAEASGGAYGPTPAAVFGGSGATVPRTVLLWPALLALAVVLLVVDVGVRRLV